ncbi:PPC domain-containing protein [Ancylothrix sp. C2]|nr:PPC domain-containing protein [Ancylothrix sp. D3o]
MTTGGAFNVSLSGLTDNADLFLLNSNNQIIQSSTSGNSSETLSFQNLSTGIYSLQITSSAGATDYLLGIQIQETLIL